MAAVEGGYHQHRVGVHVPVPVPVVVSPGTTRVPMAGASSGSRPSSALARGIQITEYRDARVNPEPLPVEESDLLLEEYLSPRKLRALTGIEDLSEVHYLEMKVDTRDTSLGNFGTHLPSLTQLKLSNSIISSARDLGSSLHCVRVLWMARCGVEDLDGLSSMNNLRELYLAYNDICDISPCSLLENLTILDLEGNNIDEISQIHFLNTCTALYNVTLEGNPVCVTPCPDEASPGYDYRRAVKQAIPHLVLLDDEPLLDELTGPRRTASVFDDDWALIDELMQDGTMQGSDESLDTPHSPQHGSRPLSSLRPTTGYRPGSALKNYHGTGIRPGTRCGRQDTSSRPGTGARLGTAGSRIPTSSGARPGTSRPGSSGRPHSGEEAESTDDTSDLTRGGVVCGNPSKALRSRHNPSKTYHSKAAKLKAQMKFKPEHTYETENINESEMKELLDELKEWRQTYKINQKKIDDSKAPQVLKIDHDDTVSLSDNDESIDSDDDRIEETQHNHNSIINDASIETPQHAVKSKNVSQGKSWKTRSRSGGRYDESFDAPDEASSSHTPEDDRSHSKSHSVEHLHPILLPDGRRINDTRPLSNPVMATKARLRAEPAIEKAKPKSIDPLNPIIRASVRSPETRVHIGPRADTAKSSLGQPAPLPSRMRKGFSNVPILPSKFNK